MLKYIKISNYILVKEIEIHLNKGLNIFSGETGAGKSVIIEAINTVLGGQVRQGMIFQKDKSAHLEICFEVNLKNKELRELLEEFNLDTEENEIFFTKIISPNLKAKTFINGIRTTNAVIKRFKHALIDFHSQRDHQKLFHNSYQLDILDDYGTDKKLLSSFYEMYANYAQDKKKLNELITREKENAEKFELYSYQLDEINDAEIKENEDTLLTDELNLLSHAEELLALKDNFNQECYEKEESVFDRINYYLAQINEFINDNSYLQQAASVLQECLANIDSAAENLEALANTIDSDPDRREFISQRLDLLNSLKQKYNRSLDEIIDYKKDISQFINNHSTEKDKIMQCKEQLAKDLDKLKIFADKLTTERKKTAQSFAQSIQDNVKKLAIPNARVDIKFKNIIASEDDYFQYLTPKGKDEIEIYFSANLGIDLQPLKIAASGGELSRFLLAVKKILAQYLFAKTIIFDEIDTGIGGKTAEYTGEFISNIASHHQVICITHLAQIAAFAHYHFMIQKVTDTNISAISVKKLDNKNIVHEIARMMSGSKSELALEHAEELIRKAGMD